MLQGQSEPKLERLTLIGLRAVEKGSHNDPLENLEPRVQIEYRSAGSVSHSYDAKPIDISAPNGNFSH